MNRSTLRTLKLGLATAVFCCATLPAAGVSHAAAARSASDSGASVDIVFGDGDEGPIFVGHVSATARQASVTLSPGDVVYGDADEGVIDAGPVLTIGAPSHAGTVNARAGQDVLFGPDNDSGGTQVDLSAFVGRSNLTSADLTGVQTDDSQAGANLMQAVDLQ